MPLKCFYHWLVLCFGNSFSYSAPQDAVSQCKLQFRENNKNIMQGYSDNYRIKMKLLINLISSLGATCL